MFVVLQPPPAITDKQLDEREHTVEEWKGTNHLCFLSSSQIDLMLFSPSLFCLWHIVSCAHRRVNRLKLLTI